MACYNSDEDLLQVQVKDDGCGIRNDEMEKLFSLFGRIDRTEKANIEGIGMGLTICKRIVDNCGGTIECYSAGENQGSTFMFSMKMKPMHIRDPHLMTPIES